MYQVEGRGCTGKSEKIVKNFKVRRSVLEKEGIHRKAGRLGTPPQSLSRCSLFLQQHVCELCRKLRCPLLPPQKTSKAHLDSKGSTILSTLLLIHCLNYQKLRCLGKAHLYSHHSLCLTFSPRDLSPAQGQSVQSHFPCPPSRDLPAQDCAWL